MKTSLFLNPERQLRSGWWILLFFLALGLLLVPALIAAQQEHGEVSIGVQASLVALASIACQLLRRKSLSELTGKPDLRWLKELFLGGLAGAALMLVPALFLGISGRVGWRWNPEGVTALLPGLWLFAMVAIAEELLFRGFIFQRLLSGLGPWPAQMITAAFFLLTHLDNPGMTGSVRTMAGINIFLASILFGLTFIRTKSLAMPLGLHWMANWVQGGILGFGVSGNGQAGLFMPVFKAAPAWLTGGPFGLEASLPGLMCVVIALLLLHRWKPGTPKGGL